MSAVCFRKIDIKAHGETVLVETELYDADPKDPVPKRRTCRSRRPVLRPDQHSPITLLSFLASQFGGPVGYPDDSVLKEDTFGSLALVLEDPPYGAGVDEAEAHLTRAVPRQQLTKASHSGTSVVRNLNSPPTLRRLASASMPGIGVTSSPEPSPRHYPWKTSEDVNAGVI